VVEITGREGFETWRVFARCVARVPGTGTR
jgi:hypothetical protein